MFDANDFDETTPGPWEWDVKRLAASFDIAARNNGYTDAERRKIVLTCSRGYRTAMATFATMSNLQVWYAHLNIEEQLKRLAAKLDPTRFKALKKNLAKARARDSVQAFTKLTRKDGGEPRIVSDPPLIVPMEELLPEGKDLDQVTDELMGVIRSYRKTLETDRRHLLEEYRFVQIARKVVGVGSVGTRSWIILLLGRDGGDPLFLQAKEAGESVLERFVGKSAFTNHGQRVVAGQRLMQANSDIFLGWQRVTGITDGVSRDFYIRQLKDMKGSADAEAMIPSGMAQYSRLCAWTLARAHARSGDRIAIASYLGKSDVFDRAIADFSACYAEQNERDYQVLTAAVKKGAIEVETGL
jgi:uncharacterized protein (DUF2252 family)